MSFIIYMKRGHKSSSSENDPADSDPKIMTDESITVNSQGSSRLSKRKKNREDPTQVSNGSRKRSHFPNSDAYTHSRQLKIADPDSFEENEQTDSQDHQLKDSGIPDSLEELNFEESKESLNPKDKKPSQPRKMSKKRRYVKNNPNAVKLFDILKTSGCTKIEKFDYFKTKLMKIFDRFLSLLVENTDNLDQFLLEHFETISNDGSTIVDEILTELNNLPETFDLKSHIAIRRLEKKYDNTYLRRLFEPDPIKKILLLVFQIQYKDIPENRKIFSLFNHKDPIGRNIFQDFLTAFPYFSEGS